MPYHCQCLVVLVGILASGTLASRAAAQSASGFDEVALRHFNGGSSSPGLPARRPLLVTSPSPVERQRSKQRCWKKAWIASWVAFAVINALDAHSSAGRAEANPLLRNANGTFSGTRAALLKSGAGAGFLAVQWWVGRRNPEHYRMFTITNTALNTGLAAIVVRNYGLSPSPPPAAPSYVRRETD